MVESAPLSRRPGRPVSAGSENTGEVQSLDRAISLLEELAGGEGLMLSEVGRRAGLPASTAHRLLTTLQRRGLAGHDPGTGLWTVGVGLFRIGSAYLRIRKLPELARPVIRELLAEVNETVNLTMLDGGDLVCVAQAESHAAVRAFFRLGSLLPLHASGAGKAILAAASPQLRENLLGSGTLKPITRNTRRTREALLADLDQVAQRGWAIDDEEHTEGMRCVSAAVLNERAEPAGAVSVSAPTIRMPSEHTAILGAAVKRTADHLTELYSGRVATGASLSERPGRSRLRRARPARKEPDLATAENASQR